MEAAHAAGIGIDLAILDYHMPQMNGADLARALRADPALSHMPIIMLTSVDHMEDGKAFSALGIEAHLSKPARSSLLLETMISVMSERQAADPVASQAEPGTAADGGSVCRPRPWRKAASMCWWPRTTR